jgi:hypothetical protein
MNRKNCFATIFVAVLCLLTSGCFNIEQEIFLEPDGSGDMVIYISMPDFPEAMKKTSPGPQQDPQKLLDEFKQKFANDLPPTIKLKEAKEVRRHGAMAFYIVLHFNQLNDVDSMLDKFSKESLSEKGLAQSAASKDESLWKIRLEKAGDLTEITQRFYADIGGALEGAMGGAMGMGKSESAKSPSDSAPPVKSQASATPKSGSKPARKARTRRTARGAEPVAPKEEDPFESMADGSMKDPMKELMNEEMMSMIFSSIFKLRFVLHAPKKITESNADIVLNGKIAIWNASLGAFAKEKKPIEMKVKY